MTTLMWPENVWTLLLQCVLTGKAQETYSSLTLEESSGYKVVKVTILSAFELVPEAYMQRFMRNFSSVVAPLTDLSPKHDFVGLNRVSGYSRMLVF